LFLVVCAPVVVDLLFGAFTVSFPLPLVPTALTYGLAALLIRAVMRPGRWWPAVVLLGAAFVVVAECLIVQTSLAPSPSRAWGRAAGVNWTYLVWALGYLNLWPIALSIQLTELIFPHHRDQPWLGRRGTVVVVIVFVAAAVPTWFNWTHIAAPGITHLPVYDPPPGTLLVAGAVAAGLVVVGRVAARSPDRPYAPASWPAPVPAVVGVTALLAGLGWFGLLIPAVTGNALTTLPPAVAIALAVALAIMTGVALVRWSRTAAWTDSHRLALIAGALVASMAAGFPANHFSTVDLVGKIILNLATIVGLGVLYRRVRRTSPPRNFRA
jgi:hypothetical protein